MLLFLKKYGLISIVIFHSAYSKAQLTDISSTFRNITGNIYFRLQYDNDFFTKTDYYYSQGVTFEYVNPGLKKDPVTRLLIKQGKAGPVYGICFDLAAYTPTSLQSDAILFGDRPYAAIMSFKTFVIGSDSIRQDRIGSALNIGVIGPAAQGKQIQTSIHRWLNNMLPKGWQNQVQNDLLLNYQVTYEKKITALKGLFLMNTTAEARFGTVNDKLAGGFNFMTGHFNDPYNSVTVKKKQITYYIFGQSRISLIGYDATLQGGLVNRKSPYTLSASDIKRLTFQADAGLALNFKMIYFSYSQSFLTKEFRTGRYHRWGGISLGFSL